MDKFKHLSKDQVQKLHHSDLIETLSPADRVNAFLAFSNRPQDERFDTAFLTKGDLRLDTINRISPTRIIITYKFTVPRYYCNGSGNLHGGAQSTIYDILTSVALIALGKKDFWLNAGVTRNLSVTFLKPAPEGSRLVLECEVLQMGKAMSLVRGVMRREEDGEAVSYCSHDKAAVRKKTGWDDEKAKAKM